MANFLVIHVKINAKSKIVFNYKYLLSKGLNQNQENCLSDYPVVSVIK